MKYPKNQEYNSWFSQCKWVEEEMCINNFEEFLKEASHLKKMYKELTPLGVKLYRMYLYSRRDLSLNRVENIWNYLNDDITLEKLTKS